MEFDRVGDVVQRAGLRLPLVSQPLIEAMGIGEPRIGPQLDEFSVPARRFLLDQPGLFQPSGSGLNVARFAVSAW